MDAPKKDIIPPPDHVYVADPHRVNLITPNSSINEDSPHDVFLFYENLLTQLLFLFSFSLLTQIRLKIMQSVQILVRIFPLHQ